jgi:hypothetical protein
VELKTRPKIAEVATLLVEAVKVNESAEKAHFAIQRYFVGDKAEYDGDIFDAIADAVADLHEEKGERDYRAKARVLVRNITGRNGIE